MTIGSSTKRKPTGTKKPASQLLVAEWTIEQAATPHYVSVSFVVHPSGDGVTTRSSTRRFLLPSESAAELMDELKEVLEDRAAAECLDRKDAADPDLVEDTPAAYASRNGHDDAEPMSDHFALGAYGLVGN